MKSWTAVHVPDASRTAAVPTWVSFASRMLARWPGEPIQSFTIAAAEMFPRAMFSAARDAPQELMIGLSDWCSNAPDFASVAAQLSANVSGQLAALSAESPRDVRSAFTRASSCDS